MMAGGEKFASGSEITGYIAAHDADARRLNRETVPSLRGIEREEMAKQGQVRIIGSGGSKDELIRSVLELRYPRIRQAWEQQASLEAAGEEAGDARTAPRVRHL